MLRFKSLIIILAVMSILPYAGTYLNAETATLSPGFSVIDAGDNYTEIEFKLSGYEFIPVEIDGVIYQRLYHPESGFILDEGLPELLSFSAIISVPDRGVVSWEEPLVKDREILKNVTIFPSQGFEFEIDDKIGLSINQDFYEKDMDYPENTIQISSPAIMRDYRLVTVNINPFSFNPARSELTINNHLTLRINYDQSLEGANEITTPPRRPSRDFEKLFRGSVLNHDQFRNPPTRDEYQKRSIIVVHHHTNDAQYVNTINQYLNWKRDKGFEVNVITTAQYNNNTSIRNYLRNAVENWEIPPEHVILVGNKSGAISVPIWSIHHPETYSGANVPVDTDHPYATLLGTDELADVFVGRINVGSATQLATFWNKLRNYERTPYMENVAWYNRQLLVGDPRVSGISTIFTSKYIKDVMLSHNPDYSFTEVYQEPFATRMQNAITQGVLFYSFRGLESVAGWWYPSPNDINNGFMMPNMIVITCRTMLWSSNLQIDALFNMGTPTVAKGSITGIGMSHVTRTAMNNSLSGGIFYGVYVNNMRTMGQSLNRGKLNLWQTFYNSHWAAEGLRHTRMINMYGDPSMDIWTGLPQNLNVEYPETLPPGSNSIRFVVTDDNEQPVEDAWVTIRRGTNIGNEAVFVTGYTDAEGVITHFFDPESTGEVTVTVTKPDYKPHLGSFDITGNQAVSFHSVTFNDDVNAGSQLNFTIVAKNYRNQVATAVNGTISTDSEYIEINENASPFGNIAANGTADSNDDFTITISPDTPSGYKALFNLTLNDNAQNTWLSRYEVIVNNGKLVKTQMIIDDEDDGILDPTEQATIRIHLQNNGQTDLEEIYGALVGGGYGLNVLSDTAYFGNIDIDETVTSRERHFIVSSSSYVIPGMNFNLSLHLFNEDGFHQIIPVTIPIGTVTVNDPLGPDEYGYWCYDSGDIDYVESPEYEWIEIYPPLGGNGTNTGIQADWNNVQGFHTMDLPFTFSFYGEEYNRVSISANGWITFGENEKSTQRNWLLPGPLGPSPIIAAFWDNLSLQQGGIFTWHDQENAKFIIQWQNARNVLNNAEETFQIILYDPEFYFTTTNDGPIKIQYRVVNNVNNGANSPAGLGNWGNYATVGIADHTAKRGLQYTFNNRYPTAARPLTNRMALYFATGSLGAAPYVAIDSFRFLDDNDNLPEYGETGDLGITLTNIGGQDAFGVSAILSSDDEYVTILQDTAEFGDMPSEATDTINDAFTIRLADNIPSNHRLNFYVSITAEGPINWNFRINLDVKAPDLTTLTSFVYDPAPGGNNDGIVDPGEDLIVFLPIKNMGGANSPPVNLTVNSQNDLAVITGISETGFETIVTGEVMYPAISISISEDAPIGTGLVFDYTFEAGEYEFSGNFLLGVGGIIPARLGTGNNASSASAASPINIYFRTLRGQAVYTAEELFEAGVTSGGPISSIGFYVVSAPEFSLVDFTIRMKHTDAEDASAHIDGPYTSVYSNNNYSPVAGDWDMLPLLPHFEWNGVDNILIDTAFAPVESWHGSGQVRIYEQENGYRFARADSPDQTGVETNNTSSDKPQIRMMIDTSAGDTSNRPENLSAHFVNRDAIRLNWTAPDEQDELQGYNVYRNGILLTEEPVEETQFDDVDFSDITTIFYYVTAVYETRETLPSNIVSVNFDEIATPQITPEQGNYYEPVQITITTETDDADIYYTLDDHEPTTDDHLYTEPFEIFYHTKVRAKAIKQGSIPSEEASAQYYILYKPADLTAVGAESSVALNWNAPPMPEGSRTDEAVSAAERISRNDQTSRNETAYRSSRNRSDKSAQREYNKDNSQRFNGYNIYRAPSTGDFTRINDTVVQDTTYNDTGLAQGEYRYYVTAVYEQGESQPSETVNANVGQSSVEEEPFHPYITELRNAYPNPFNPETSIGFSVGERERVLIEIYDITGRRVKTLTNEEYDPGKHHVVWEGDDNRGNRVGSGIYFYKMQTSAYQDIKKIVLLK